MKLTAEEKREIAEEQRRYPDRRAACVEALKIAQRSRGWISDETLRELAEHLGMTADELDAVATFYNMIFRRPVGRHVIFLCDSVSCWVMGEERLRARLKERLGIEPGQTTPDGEYTLLPVACLGACDRAPALLLDRELHGDVTEQKLDLLVRRGG
jgi:NADH-quinone oxidoreductase subunit E